LTSSIQSFPALPDKPLATSAGKNKKIAKLAEVVSGVYDFTPAAVFGYSIAMGVVAGLFWNLIPPLLLGLWMAAFLSLCGARWFFFKRFQKAQPQTLGDWRLWQLRTNALTVAAASLWGIAGWFFYDYAQNAMLEQTGLILIIYTFFVVAIPVLAQQRTLCIGYAVCSCLPLVLRIGLKGDGDHLKLASELLLIVVATFFMANRYRHSLERAIDLKIQADELAAQLKVETLAAQTARAQAEIARAEAETATRAKTQFFAAASHDLRQPLHAMGLFAEALRQRVHQDPQVVQLVNSVNQSVDALEALFTELLQITNIDSGGVQLKERHFEASEVFRNLRLHFEPNAFEKGLTLRFRGEKHQIWGDSVQIERILRNLVANAIRYTNEGTVLVSCRRRANQVLLQVWDTGLGIRQSEQQRIFDEFYQVPNTPRLSADQRKGLGLGLSIVKRLADLMKAPLGVRSESGRGSVFTLTLPVGNALASAPPLPALVTKATHLTLAGRLVVLVEDEPAVLAGLEVLLRSWDAQVVAFDSVAASRAWAAHTDPTVIKPDLLIVDYRLEEGSTGVDAIQLLRKHFGANLPAIVVTGSAMPGPEVEAQAHNFHLLIKPVVPNKLRAMIAFKLARSKAAK
jgi:two-component system, sensor histidine kinase